MSWYGPIGRNLGLVLRRYAFVVATLPLVSIVWGEYYAIPAELLSAAIVYGLGLLLTKATSSDGDTSAAQAFASAALVWLVVGLLSALPFLGVAATIALEFEPGPLVAPPMNRTVRAFLSVDNAAFEALSGITGTGLTVTRNPSDLPATLQWWRSALEWLGGIGVIVLVLSIVREVDANVLDQYYEQRSPLGEAGDEIPPPQVMVGAFTAFTLLSIGVLWLAGMPPWHAINHGMTGLSTGGFAVTDSSIAAYDGLAIRVVLLPIMLVGAIPLPVYYLILKGKFEGFANDLQTRWLVPVAVIGSALVAGFLFATATYRPMVEHGIVAAFQFVSAITCTGFTVATDMGSRWPTVAMLSLTVAMIVGGSEGSTASGVKIVRVISVAEGVRERIWKPFPDAPDPSDEIRIRGEHASANFYNASIVLTLWLTFLLLGVFALLLTGPTSSLEAAVFEVASAQGNVGLSTGLTSPTLAASAKTVLMVNMWVGRLTIIPVLILFRGSV